MRIWIRAVSETMFLFAEVLPILLLRCNTGFCQSRPAYLVSESQQPISSVTISQVETASFQNQDNYTMTPLEPVRDEDVTEDYPGKSLRESLEGASNGPPDDGQIQQYMYIEGPHDQDLKV
eukprot:Lankesteria_metandrocarpae@DN4197_c1_g1_i1.p1